MKKVIAPFLLCILLSSIHLQAQEVKMTWSEKQIYKNSLDGFFNSFVGGNSKYIYARFTNVSRRKSDHVRLVSFDKKTMVRENMVELFEGDKTEAAQYSGLVYYKTVIFEDLICVFWTNDSKGKKELYVQSFDASLAPHAAMKKIYEMSFDPKSKKKPAFFVLGNPKVDDHILIGGELAGNKDESVRFEYKLLKKDFSVANSSKVELPVVTKSKSSGLTSTYEYGEDGNIHITSVVELDREQRKALPKGEASRFVILSMVNPAEGKIKSHNLKFDGKNVFRSGYVVDKGVTKIYAFFTDLEKDPSGRATHGIVYGILNNKTMDVEHVNFSYFTKAQMDKLYANDKEDQKKAKASSKNEKKKKSDDESIQADYVVEDVQSVGEDLVLFCTRMRNYSVTTCDSKGNCHTNYYCEKRNVTAFRLGKDGKLIWASNMDRKITYPGWDVDDVTTIHSNTKYYVSYGSQFQIGAEKKNRRARKSGAQMTDKFEYAVFDVKTGDFVKKEYKVNPDNTKKAEKKMVVPADMVVIDNVFYANSTHINAGARLIPFAIALTMDLVGVVLVFKDFIDNTRNEELFSKNQSYNNPNYDPNAVYKPNHTELYVGIGLIAGGTASQFILPKYFLKGSGNVGKIEPNEKK